MSKMTDEEAIRMAVNQVLENNLFPARVFVPNVPFDNDPPPTEVVLVEVGAHQRPFVVGRRTYLQFITEVDKCRKSR